MPSAVKLVTKAYTVTASPVGLHTILGYRPGIWVRSITMRAARTNSGDVYWSDPDLDSGGFLGPGEAVTIDMGEGMGFADEVYINGASGAKLYLSVEVCRYFFELDTTGY